MTMYNPPHPGEFIKETYLDPFDISQNEMAEKLGISPSTFNRLIRGQNGISPEMAIRLSKVLGRTPESWMSMQNFYDLHITASEDERFSKLERFYFPELMNSSTNSSTFT
jgi:antitoxin HigA-1